MRAERLLSIMLRLQERKKVTARELSNELGVSVRTIYRDIDALGMAGIPIYTQRGEAGGCFLDESYRVTLTDLNLGELQALFVMGGANPLEALNIHQRVEDSLLKLLASLPTHYQAQAKALQQRLYIDTRRWNQHEDNTPFLDVIQSAIWQDKYINAVYQPYDKSPRKIQIAPFGLVVKTHIWYLVGLPDGQSDYRVYRVSRFHDVTSTDKSFVRDPDFNLQAVWHALRDSFESAIAPDYSVIFRLPSSLVYILDYYVPNRYDVIEETDELTLVEARFYHINEARPVMLGFGNRVEILSPAELATSVLAYARSIVDQSQNQKHDR